MHFEIYNMRLQMRAVDSTNLAEQVDFSAPAVEIFKDDKIGNRIQHGFTQYKDTQGFNLNGNAVSSDYLKHAIFSTGATVIKLVNKQKSSPD